MTNQTNMKKNSKKIELDAQREITELAARLRTWSFKGKSEKEIRDESDVEAGKLRGRSLIVSNGQLNEIRK